MERSNSVARRRALKLAGGVAATALVAGCLSGDDSGEESNDGNETPNGENETANDDATGDDGTARDTEDERDDGNEGADDEPPSTTDPEAWEGVDEIVLSATTSSWEGLEPELIEGAENPTLVLFEGNEYVITWENADGQSHNLEVWDDDEAVVADYSTELMAEENETQSLEIVASEEMAEYTCQVHVDWGKRASIEIEAADS